MTGPTRLALSVVIPVHNGVETLERCLTSVFAQVVPAADVIVVDDGSTDDSAALAARLGATVIRLDRQSGVAAARNRGADKATGSVLFFVDADVVLHGDAIARGVTHMADASIDAVIGSYDDTPAARTLVSRFKNLAHHYFHQRAAGRVGSFWGACGFIRRDVFQAVGGFDERRFVRPSIEDVELGWRIADRGGHIVLDPQIQVTHLKRWTLRSLVATDVIDRAIPWVRWSIERGRLSGELNAGPLQQVASLVSVMILVSGVAAISFRGARVPLGLSIAAALGINWRLFRLFWRKGGPKLWAAGLALQQLYYLCALTGVALGVARYCWPGRRSVSAPPARAGC